MKLLLVNPYFGQVTKGVEAATHSPPLGLGFIATYVRDQTDCEVQIIDPIPQGLEEQDVLEEAAEADFVGLPTFTDIRFQCFDFAKKVKETNPKCTLIAGGVHAFFLDRLIFDHYPFIDVVVRGEGEESVTEIVQGQPSESIAGITWKNRKGQVIKNPARALVKNIDPLYIDYELLPDMSLYKPDIEAPIDLKKLKTAYMIESRGCPFKCTYCANQHWQGLWRAVSPARTVEKMSHLVDKYHIEYFRFYDDLFTADKKRVLEFCRILKQRKLGVRFRVLIRGNTSRDILEALKEAGCESVGLGIESGSDKMLKKIRKGVTRRQIINTIGICKELKLWVVGSFIVSLPSEGKKDFRETLSLASLPDTFMTNVLHLFPGTPLFDELKTRGEMNDQIWFDRRREGSIFYCKENFSSAGLRLNEAVWLARYTKYYAWIRNPRRTLRQYGSITGLLIIIFAILDTPFKGRLYKIIHRYRNIYRKFTMDK